MTTYIIYILFLSTISIYPAIHLSIYPSIDMDSAYVDCLPTENGNGSNNLRLTIKQHAKNLRGNSWDIPAGPLWTGGKSL